MTELKKPNASWIALLIPYIILVLIGLAMAVAPEFFLNRNFRPFTALPWSGFSASSPKVALFISLALRLLGVQFAILGSTFVVIDLTAFRSGKRWSWYVSLLGNTVGWGSGIIHDAMIGMLPIVVIGAVLLATVYVCLGLSAKSLLGRASA